MTDQFIHEYTANVFLLGLLIYREAASEPYEGKVAVGYTVMNRVDHPGWWGTDPYSVITAPKQYTSITYLGDPMTIKYPRLSDPVFLGCLQIAERIFLREVANPVPGCDSYYAVWMDAKGATPKWADPKKFVKQIANHKFYNLDGDPARA